jgi:hypothetical protein
MRPLFVVLAPPLFDGALGIGDRGEPVRTETFVAQLSVKLSQ